MRNKEEPFASISVKEKARKDLYEKFEHHSKQRELYCEIHQAVLKGKTEEGLSESNQQGNP